jgi:hypothetical protein
MRQKGGKPDRASFHKYGNPFAGGKLFLFDQPSLALGQIERPVSPLRTPQTNPALPDDYLAIWRTVGPK